MKLSGDDYILGAGERIHTSRLMFEEKRFVDCIYLAGVAVECVLRAFATDTGAPFDAKHDLRKLMKAATLERFVSGKQRQALSAALGEVWARWKNNYRYVGTDRLKAEFKQLELDRGLKGDFLKPNAELALDNGLTLVSKGTYQWQSKKK